MCTSKILQDVGKKTLNSIEESYNYVASRSKHVAIDKDALSCISCKILNESSVLSNQSWIESSKIVNFSKFTLEETIEFLIFFHNINFSYWGNWGKLKWKIYTLEHGFLDGSQAMLYVCQKILIDNGFNPENLSRITFKQFCDYFDGNCQIPLLRERYHNTIYLYSDICEILRKKDLTCSYDLFRSLNLNDEVVLGVIMNYFKYYFEDSSIYNGHKIYFYKRAQLLTADIINLLYSKGIVKEKPVHILGCADYKIPQILRALGVLNYDNLLASYVDCSKEIYKDHSFEVEIRANMLKAVELISQSTNLSRMEVNDSLWLLSQKLKNMAPYHLVRTTAY